MYSFLTLELRRRVAAVYEFHCGIWETMSQTILSRALFMVSAGKLRVLVMADQHIVSGLLTMTEVEPGSVP